MTLTLGHTISQSDPLYKPGDIDDCWVTSTIQAARAVGGQYSGPGHIRVPAPTGTTFVSEPDIPTFRKFAGRPDVQGVSNGGTSADVLKGAIGCWPNLSIVKASTAWTTFVHEVRDLGWTASVALKSALLPKELQYSFPGLHQCAIGPLNATECEFTNPLDTTSRMPWHVKYTDLRSAIEGFNAGQVAAVLFKAATVVVTPAPAPAPVPTPAPAPVPTPDPTPFSQADIDRVYATGHDEGYTAGVAATKAAAHIVYE